MDRLSNELAGSAARTEGTREKPDDARRRFDEILAEYGAALARLAASYTTSASDRDDLLQEIALALWSALPNFRGECSQRTFLYRVAHNRAITHLARRKPDSVSIEDDFDIHDSRPGPEASAWHAQQKQHLLAGVRRLPLAYRQVVILLLEGLSYAEIGEVLGLEENAVGVRLNRARRLLRDILGGTS